jgi:hypothetical protein
VLAPGVPLLHLCDAEGEGVGRARHPAQFEEGMGRHGAAF